MISLNSFSLFLKGKIITDVNLPQGSKFLKKTPDGYNSFKTELLYTK